MEIKLGIQTDEIPFPVSTYPVLFFEKHNIITIPVTIDHRRNAKILPD